MESVKVVLLFLYFQFIVSILAQTCDKPKNKHSRLKTDLLCGYDKEVMPKLDGNGNSTRVSVGMLLKFLTYTPTTDTLSVSSWLTVIWRDDHLKWTPSDYGDLKSIHLSSDSIWTPDLSLYNRVDHTSDGRFTTVDCIVYSTGNVVCVPPTQHDAMCVPDLTRYPYDVQNCTLRYGSWVHSGEELNISLSLRPVSVEDYIPNGSWELLSVNATKNEGKFKCCPNNTYPSLSYNFILARHSSVYACTIIVPALVMITMTILTLCLDPQFADRICLSCANFICHYMYIQYIGWEIPLSGLKPPMILLYTRDSLVLVLWSLIMTVLNKNLSKTTRESPYWISKVVTTIVTSRVGGVVLFLDSSLKNIANIKLEEDGTNIIDNSQNQTNKDWLYIAKILDQISLVSFFLVYFCMFIAFVP